MQTAWDYRLVGLSVFIAIIGSYVALECARKLKTTQGIRRSLWFSGGAILMGLAIWTMHFIGMLALKMPMPVNYDAALSALSMLAAAIGSGIAFGLLNREKIAKFHFIAGSVAMGLAILAMHYIGMASMRMHARIQYDPFWFSASVVIAIGASGAALWLAYYRGKSANQRSRFYKTVLSALAMGIAISGMHYAGMTGISYIPVTTTIRDVAATATVGEHYTLADLLIGTSAVFGFMLFLLAAQLASERQQMLENLKASEERFARVLEGSNEGYWEWDVATDQLYWSPQLRAMLGMPIDAWPLSFEGFSRLLMDGERDIVLGKLNHSLETGDLFREEFRMRHADGHLIECFSRGKPYYDENGQIVKMAGMITDITENKRMHEALRESEARFRQIAESNLIGIAFWNIYGKIYDANDIFLLMLGYSLTEMREGQLNWQQLTLPQDQLAHAEAVQKAIAGQSIVPYETQFIHKDGHKVDVMVGFAMLKGSRDQGFSFVMDISDRKAAEEALRETAQKLRYMSESMPQKVWTALPNGDIEYMNRNWMTYSGMDWSQLQYSGWVNLVHQDDYAETKRLWDAAIQNSMPAQLEHRLRRYDGVYRWHLSRGVPMKDEAGKVIMWIGTSTDIDDLKQAQQSLQESEERFRLMADQAPLNIWVTDMVGDTIYVNKSWVEFTGMTYEQCLGKGWLKLIHPDYQAGVLEQYEQAVRHSSVFEYECWIRRADGQYRWLYSKAAARFTPSGEHAGFVGTTIDITEQKRVATELETLIRERTSDLQKSNQMLQSIIENVPVMIFVKNATDLRFELFNKAGQEITGYTEQDFLGKNDYDFFPPEQAAFFIAKDRETLRENKLLDISEEPIKTRHGDIRILHTRKVPILDNAGNALYLLGVSEDITDYKEAKARIESLNEQLQEQINNLNVVNKELEAFSYSVSHDLRAPLRTIDGFSQAIQEDYADQLDEDGKRYLSRIREGSQQMAQLIDDMLNLSRLTRGDIRKEPLDLSNMARAIAADLQVNEPGRTVDFMIPDHIMANADKHLMQSVLQNLLGNAWKFTSHVASALIEFGVSAQGGKTVYFVRDNGAGFDMAYVDKLFGVFQRLHDVQDFPGTGVGLASVQRIIHRHGGEIWAEGAVGKGATFYFTL